MKKIGPSTRQTSLGASAGRISFVQLFLTVALLAVLVPIAFGAVQTIRSGLLERDAPTITFDEVPRGVGLVPVQLLFTISDSGAGLDEVVVRARQRRSTTELLRKKLEGRPNETIAIDFAGKESGFESGELELEIRVFDRSYWSNHVDKVLALKVDYGRPYIEPITTQHNARAGGSQLIFYRVSDENLALSGVRVGSRRFPGFPARGIDDQFSDTAIYAAIYGIPVEDTRGETPRVTLFAEDVVGNSASTKFYNKVLSRDFRTVRESITEGFLRRLGNEFSARNTENLSAADLFSFLLSVARNEDTAKLLAELKGPRFERLWDGAFIQQAAVATGSFGDLVNFTLGDQTLATLRREGYELRASGSPGEIVAANRGVVAFTGNLGTYGVTVILDHGFGVASAYSQLATTSVKRGDIVNKGDVLGAPDTTGIARQSGTFFQLFVSGVPVDAREWWDRSWVQTQIVEKIEEAKKVLGIPVYRRLDR